MLSVIMPSAIMLSISFYFCYAEYYYAESCYPECHYAECCYLECRLTVNDLKFTKAQSYKTFYGRNLRMILIS